MDEYYVVRERSRWKEFIRLVAAALVGGLLVIAILPAILPRMLPEAETPEPAVPWEPRDEQVQVPMEHQQTAVVEAVSQVSPAVVGVTRYMRSRGFGQTTSLVPSGVGSGVIFSQDGYIVTNYHVVEQAAAVIVTLSDGTEVEAEIIGEDPGTDLAVLKIEPQGEMPVAQFGDSEQLVPGEFAIAIGNPGGLDLRQSVSLGVISATDRSIEVFDWVFGMLQTDAAINPGNSGGPLVNLKGQVVGINSVKLMNAEGLGFSIPSNLVKSVIEALKEHGRVIRPMLGVQIQEVNPSVARTHGLSKEYGLYVNDTPAGGPAQVAGIQSGDIIIEADGERIESLRDLRLVLSRKSIGQEVEIVVDREGETLTFTVVLEDLAN